MIQVDHPETVKDYTFMKDLPKADFNFRVKRLKVCDSCLKQ